MESREGITQNHALPAGFTYLAQFIDHDITFDPSPIAERRRSPPVNFRTPRLDLDSVYGLGPVVQPYLYDRKATDAKLLVGHRRVLDLPRNGQGRALIGDARNDENVIVAQLHLLFIRFHNAVVDRLVGEGTPEEELFEAARGVVRRHYQWIVAHEFLPKVVGDDVARAALEPGTWRAPIIPVEFSGAAYRFGHSMVRPDYGLKRLPPEGAEPPSAIPLFPNLAGRTWLREEHVIDWERFFALGGPRPQPSLAIDTTISRPLYHLPESDPKLPRRNLLRGRKLELPSGQTVARAMHAPLLDAADLQLDGVPAAARKVLERSTPLWYYVLCEAQAGGGKQLGPVGGRIVADVLAALLLGDPTSYVHEDWRPPGGDFTIADLVRIATGA